MTVKLTWTNIPFDRFQFEDDRQRITQKSQNDGRFAVVLQIEPCQTTARGYEIPDRGAGIRTLPGRDTVTSSLTTRRLPQRPASGRGEKRP